VKRFLNTRPRQISPTLVRAVTARPCEELPQSYRITESRKTRTSRRWAQSNSVVLTEAEIGELYRMVVVREEGIER
jgi:hypothetical protein